MVRISRCGDPALALNAGQWLIEYAEGLTKGKRQAKDGDIFLTQSTNGGTTWGAPVKVNDDATTRDQWSPALSITPDGANVFVSWYDRRNDPSNSLIERFGVLGAIDGGGAVTFQPNQLISSSNFPVVRGQDPVVNSVYIGDYDQVVATNTNFCITWGDNRLGNPNWGFA